MRITKIEVHNFKSLRGFELPLPKFCCLTGLNGSGKSTVLQFLDFIAQQARGDITGWLEERGWKAAELPCKLVKSSGIEFAVQFTDSDTEISWAAKFDHKSLRCVQETIKSNGATCLEVKSDQYAYRDDGKPGDISALRPIEFKYQGSILSALVDEKLPRVLLRLRDFLRDIETLEMLTPERLRQRVRQANGSLGLGGRNLAAFIHDLGEEKRLSLVQSLRRAYPQLQLLNSQKLRSGWKQLYIEEQFKPGLKEQLQSGRLATDASHINDGTLRLLAVLAELASKHEVIIFDEIENGINPELVELLITQLQESPKQVVLTTHSPLILNYLDDAAARAAVVFVFKNAGGFTQAKPLFEIPSLAEKLAVMGPGEAFADTDLTTLSQQLSSSGQVS